MSSSPQLVVVAATMRWDGWERCIQTWRDQLLATGDDVDFLIVDNTEIRRSITESYSKSVYFLDKAPHPYSIIGFLHDDLEIHEQGWNARVLKAFEDPKVGMVCFAGAPHHGADELYTSPYDLGRLIRIGFRSNMVNAEAHGARTTEEQDVTVCDGFAFFVRREIVEKWNWPGGYFMYTEWLCCQVRRLGFRIRLVPVLCNHIGGRTSSFAGVRDDGAAAHREFWEGNRDVMPGRLS